jgi:hypothetical protein
MGASRAVVRQRRSHVRTGQQGARELQIARDGGPGAVGQADRLALALFRLRRSLDAQGNLIHAAQFGLINAEFIPGIHVAVDARGMVSQHDAACVTA